jgi:hypothetical protein
MGGVVPSSSMLPAHHRVRFHDPTAVRARTAAERFQEACDLHDLAKEMIAARVRRERPSATDADVEDAIRGWLQGGDLEPGPRRA